MAEGVHPAIRRRMGCTQAHLNDVVDRLSRNLDLHNQDLRQELEYDHQKERTDLQTPLHRRLHNHISYYALDEVEKHRRFHNQTTQTAKVSLEPCKHILTTTQRI